MRSGAIAPSSTLSRFSKPIQNHAAGAEILSNYNLSTINYRHESRLHRLCAYELSALWVCRCVGRRQLCSYPNMSIKVAAQGGLDEFSDSGAGAVLSD